MTPDQGGDVGRVLHAALSRSVPDGEPVSGPQTDGDPVQGGTAARWVGRQVGRLGIEQCTNSDQGQRRFRYLPLGGDRGEQALLLRRRTRRDRRGRRFRGAVVYCSPTCVAANRGHFAILPSLQCRPDNRPQSKIFAHFRSADTDLYIARITESMWGGFRGIFGGTLPGAVQRSDLFDRIHRAILNCPKVHLRDDYERQAGFREGHDSYEFTYDWPPPFGVAENPIQSWA
jgi:hypothetical protein